MELLGILHDSQVSVRGIISTEFELPMMSSSSTLGNNDLTLEISKEGITARCVELFRGITAKS